MDESVWDISFIWDYVDDNYFGKSGTCVSPKGMRTKPLAPGPEFFDQDGSRKIS